MRPDRLEELLWQRVDGTITPDEQGELETFLAEHPESKDLVREIARLAELLAPPDETAPPPALRGRIDEALAAATPPVHLGRIPRTVRARRWGDRWPPRLLPVAASLVLGVAIGYLLQPSATGTIDESLAVGAMGGVSVTPNAAPVIVDLGADTGRIVADRVGSELTVNIGLVRPLDLRLDIEATAGEIRLIESVNSSGSPSTLAFENGELTVRTGGPCKQRINAALTEGSSRVRIRATADGTVVREWWIE